VELTQAEIAEIQLVAEQLKPYEIVEVLNDFLQRERALYERMPQDDVTKKSMLYGISCLVAAAAKLSQDQTTSPESKTPGG
jgi:hypothetical protein